MKNNEENKLNEVCETPEITVLNVNEKTELGEDGTSDGYGVGS